MQFNNHEALNTPSEIKTTWFVGAQYSGSDNQTQRFITEGIWENGYEDKYLNDVRSMRVGDKIVIKSAYTRKYNLPFDNRNNTVSVMGIKAIGTITENMGDGRCVKVLWSPLEATKEWYFYTNRTTIWRVQPGDWMADELLAFTFNNKPQDFERFQNGPYWKDRFGIMPSSPIRFAWAKFYQEIANKLLVYKNNRAELLAGIEEIASRIDGLGYLADDIYSDGSKGFVKDICPFTVMGMFNRRIKDSTRIQIITELAKLLNVEEEIPTTFESIPALNNLKSWYFPYEIKREADHIDALWDVFARAIEWSDSRDEEKRHEFAKAFDHANGRLGVKWNLTFGLYWIRPWDFVGLDQNSRTYINNKLGLIFERKGLKGLCTASNYMDLMEILDSRFEESGYPVHSYPELSLEAVRYKIPASDIGLETDEDEEEEVTDIESTAHKSMIPYSVEDIIGDGCFLDSEEIKLFIDRLRFKKNLILQGPPGTGKTWLAKRLGYALIGQKDDSKIRAVQFHPNLSYEDFVRGWRPTGEGKLSLVDGVFMEAIHEALQHPSSKVVVIIEEINRGNPAQIFGELLTLLESSKRNPNEALELCYPDKDGQRRPVHIPENLYVIGTMNIADRSLAMMDLALRRRFAFVNLEPRLGKIWRNWVVNQCSVDPIIAEKIEHRFHELNKIISSDHRLGKQFCIGHSYVTPTQKLEVNQTTKWFEHIVDSEISPLLDEYWYDAPDEASAAISKLKQDW